MLSQDSPRRSFLAEKALSPVLGGRKGCGAGCCARGDRQKRTSGVEAREGRGSKAPRARRAVVPPHAGINTTKAARGTCARPSTSRRERRLAARIAVRARCQYKQATGRRCLAHPSRSAVRGTSRSCSRCTRKTTVACRAPPAGLLTWAMCHGHARGSTGGRLLPRRGFSS